MAKNKIETKIAKAIMAKATVKTMARVMATARVTMVKVTVMVVLP
jgi:hypothetical protein